MLRRFALTSTLCAAGLAVAASATGGARTTDFPAKATYLFFIQGAPAGRSDIECTAEGGAYVFRSTSKVTNGESTDTLSCRTEFDQKTLRPRLFEYTGRLSGESASGTIRVEGDSAFSRTETAGNPFSARLKWTEPTLIFQNFVPEHLLVVSRFLAASKVLAGRFTIMFPADMMFVPGAYEVASEVELPTKPAPSICKKFGIAIQSSFPFYMYVDQKRSLPVYMEFPGVQTEMFLQSAFGDSPRPKFNRPAAPAAQQ
jgi:hypothetical protein